MPPAPPRNPIPVLAALDLAIQTARLRLRPLREADAEALWPYVSDPQLPRLMSWAAHADIGVTRAWLAGTERQLAEGTSVRWAIVHDGTLVGCVALEDVTFQIAAWRIDRAELGYWIAPQAERQGLMTEAAAAVVRYAFETIGLHKVTVSCLAQNAASKRVIEKLGFRYVGRAEDDVWRDDQWHAHLRYELTAPEWPDVHTTLRIDRRTVTG